MGYLRPDTRTQLVRTPAARVLGTPHAGHYLRFAVATPVVRHRERRSRSVRLPLRLPSYIGIPRCTVSRGGPLHGRVGPRGPNDTIGLYRAHSFSRASFAGHTTFHSRPSGISLYEQHVHLRPRRYAEKSAFGVSRYTHEDPARNLGGSTYGRQWGHPLTFHRAPPGSGPPLAIETPAERGE